MKPALNVNLTVGSRVGVGAGVGGVGGAADIFVRWSLQNATLTITNPTDQTWVYTVILLSSAFMSLPFFFEHTLAPGESASKTITITMIGEVGEHDIIVQATEVGTGTVLYDGVYLDTITIVQPVAEIEVSIAWDQTSKVFTRWTTQWATLTITNPTDQTWVYNVFLLSSAFILGLPAFFEQTLAPGESASARFGPLMIGEAGAHDVIITVDEVGIITTTRILDGVYLDTITIVQPIPALDMELSWQDIVPPTTTWSFPSDGTFERELPDTFEGVVILNDLLDVPSQVAVVWGLDDAGNWISWRPVIKAGSLLTLVAGKVYTVVVTGAC